MINQRQLRDLIVRPVLTDMGLHSMAAENLLMGTAAVESRGGFYLQQVGGGPALGIFQMEPATHADLADRYLRERFRLGHSLQRAAGVTDFREAHLISNLKYAAGMARVRYFMVPEALPEATDIEGLARYWKKHYNTILGKGEEAAFVRAFDTIVGG